MDKTGNINLRSAALARIVSPLAFGGAPLGNLYETVDPIEATRSIEHAWTAGIRHFDTAPYYGYGLSETRLGEVLSGKPRDSFTLSTKAGRLIETDATASARRDGFAVEGRRAVFDYSRDGIMRSVEASLSRLRTDRIELLLLHDIGKLTHGAAHVNVLRQALDEALPTLAELRSQGVCGAIGIGVNEQEVCLQVIRHFDLDAIMLAGRYTLFEQEHSVELMAAARMMDIAILAAGPYNSGLLSGDTGPGDVYDYAPVDAALSVRAQRFYDICRATDTTVGAAALQFPLAHPAVITVVCGLRSVAEVEAALIRRDAHVPSATWGRLRADGLLRADVDVPA